MKKNILILFIGIFTYTNIIAFEDDAPFLPKDSPIDLNESTIIIGNGSKLIKDTTDFKIFKDFSIARLKSHNDFGAAALPNITSSLHKFASEYNGIKFKSQWLEKVTETKSQQIIKKFFLLFTLVNFINNRFSDFFSSQEYVFISSTRDLLEQGIMIRSFEHVNLLIAINRFIELIAQYQQNHNPAVLEAIFNSNIVEIAQKFLETEHNNPPRYIKPFLQVIGEIYDILINEITIYLRVNLPIVSSRDHLTFFLDTELRKLTFYYRHFGDTEDPQEFKESKFYEYLGRIDAHNHFESDKFIYVSRGKLHVNLPADFQIKWFSLYNQATKNNQSPLYIDIKDFWAGTIQIPVTPNISGMIEGYVPPVEASIETKPQQTQHKSDKAIAAEVKALLKDLGLEEKTTSKKGKKDSPSSTTQPQSKKGKKPQPVAAAADEEKPEAHVLKNSIYRFNDRLFSKKILVEQRIKDWYQFTPKGSCKGITKQGYLTPGTNRNKILRDEIAQCKGDENKALANIIFRHQLPYSLIHSILSYGTISPNSTDQKTSITALVFASKRESEPVCYQAEIIGSIEGNTFHILHSFLRPVDNIKNTLQNILSNTVLPFEQDEEDESDFIVLGEQEGWKIDDRKSNVIISRDGIQYILCKN